MEFDELPSDYIIYFSEIAKGLAAFSGFVNSTIYLLQGQVQSDEAFLEDINHELSIDTLLQEEA